MFVLKWARLSEHTSARRVGLQPGGCQGDGNKAGHERPPEKTHKAEDKEVGVIIQLVLDRLLWGKQVPTNKGPKPLVLAKSQAWAVWPPVPGFPFWTFYSKMRELDKVTFEVFSTSYVSKLKSPKCARRFTLLIISKCFFHPTVSFDPDVGFTKSVNDFILVRCHMHTTTFGA